ncbi:phage portal protein [Eubacteriaceae bacterium ES3]|nr:phage portal protein [Eubacteriaceae bacterium ES3]
MRAINIFNRFKKKEPDPQQMERAELISGNNSFSPWSGDAYSLDIYRGGVDSIARNCGKLKGSHIISYANQQKTQGDERLNRILQVAPNPYMTAYDFLYKMVTHYYLYNNAFAYLQKDKKGQVIGIYPMGANQVEFLTDPTETMYCKFLLTGGKEVILPYADIIHLRRNFNENDLLGDQNTAIMDTLELAHAQSEGMVTSIQTSANIRGLIKHTTILNDESLEESRKKFMENFLQMNNNGGVAVIDQKMEYTPINQTPANIDTGQIEAIKTKIYNYLGISESIVNSSYNEDQFSAFYESTLEPIALQLSLEFTRKIFNDREQEYGNKICFESGRLIFSSNATKVRMIRTLVPLGLLSINQALEILNLPSIPDGDKRIQTLNVISQDKADQYQLNDMEDEEI